MRWASWMAMAVIALASMFLVVAMGRDSATGRSCKPESPIELRLTLLEENRSEGLFRVAVETRSETELPGVTVRARVAGNGRLLQAAESGPLSLSRGKALRDQWSIRTLPGPGATLIVTAESRLEGVVLSRSAILDLGDVQQDKASVHTRMDAQGREFAEVRAKSGAAGSP